MENCHFDKSSILREIEVLRWNQWFDEFFVFCSGNGALLQKMSKLHSLEVHRGCVNTIWWDETGQYLLSGSDDHRLVITGTLH